MTGSTVRDRILDAVLVCVEREGLNGLALEHVAATAAVGRATIYRQFAGGRDELIREAVRRELATFWSGLAAAVSHLDGLEDRLVLGLMIANERISHHRLLQKLLSSEPEELLPTLFESESEVNVLLRRYLLEMLARQPLRAGVDPDHAADYLARMLLLHIGSHGRWDLTDEAQVRRLVRTQFLAGILP